MSWGQYIFCFVAPGVSGAFVGFYWPTIFHWARVHCRALVENLSA